MIAIIDYGMGNLRSVEKGFEKVGAKVIVTREPNQIRKAAGIVLPGVGAFLDCMTNLKKFGLIDPIKESIALKKPFLGICLGLQLLFESSQEGQTCEGLSIFKGVVKKFQKELPQMQSLKIPHMGWNQIKIKKESPILKGISENDYVYFVHSYYIESHNQDLILTETEYGINFISSIAKDNLFAMQFHPEKSQDIGLKILKNFTEIVANTKIPNYKQ